MNWNELINESERVLQELKERLEKEEWELFLDSVYHVLYDGS